MPDGIEHCISCNRPKAVDGFRFCGGSYCLHDADEPLDRLLDDDWAGEGNANEPEER